LDHSAIRSFAELRARAAALGPKRVAVAMAEDDIALTAVDGARALGIATPLLIGDAAAIRARAAALGFDALMAAATVVPTPDPAAMAARMAGAGEADLILKGHLRTDQLLRAVLDPAHGLRTGRLLSDVLLYEDTLAGERRLVGITDGGLNVAPDLEKKRQIVLNAIAALHGLGLRRPRIAVMSASEAVSDAMPSTIDAQALTALGEQGAFGEAEVFGPLALDNALLASAAEAKGIRHPVAGHADCLVVPSIEAGNLLGKAVKYFAGSACAHVVVGARVPVLIPSRVESAEDKINAIAFGVIHAAS
jgi:phosphate butyryltransferase